MSFPDRYMRRPTPVEAMALNTLTDLHCAEIWLRGHGVTAAHRHPALTGRGLLIPRAGTDPLVARLGQWLVHDLTTGRFQVADDDLFHLTHDPAPPAAAPTR